MLFYFITHLKDQSISFMFFYVQFCCLLYQRLGVPLDVTGQSFRREHYYWTHANHDHDQHCVHHNL